MSDFPTPDKLIDDTVRRAALRTLELARDADQWDMSPVLGFVADVDGEAVCVHIPVPDELWHQAPPAVVLHSMSVAMMDGMVGLQLEIDTSTIRGMILLTEGHAVDTDELTDAEKVTLDDYHKRHRLERHPKSRELRMAHMIDRGMTQAMGRHFRGDPVSDKIIYGFTGRVPDALEEFMTIVLAAWMEEAETPN